MKRRLTFLYAIGILFFCSASIEAIEDDAQLWVTAQLKAPVRNHIALSVAFQPRFHNSMSDLERILIRPSVGFHFHPHIVGTLGYDVHALNATGTRAFEHRIWQQLSLKHQVGDMQVTHRVRLEERLIENVSGKGIRGRLRLHVKIPNVLSDWYVAGGNEVFYNLNTVANGPDGGYNQNRTFLGLGRVMRGRVHVVLGYQLQHINGNGTNRINHVMTVGLSIFDLDDLQ